MPTKLLVDGCHGVYCWKNLAERYPLFKEDGSPLTEEELSSLKGEDWPEAVDFLEPLYVRQDERSNSPLWLIYQDGDIWAVHPDAEWSDEEEWFVFGGSDE